MAPSAHKLGPSQRSLVWFALLLFGLWIPALLDSGAVEAVSNLHHLAKSSSPYFILDHAWLLYIRAPLAGISGWVMCLTPGLLLTPLLCDDLGVNRWFLYGFSLSLVVVSPITVAAQSVAGGPLTGPAFITLLSLVSLLCFFIAFIGIAADRPFGWPISKPESLIQGLFLLIGAWILSALLTPKIYWEVFNGDGVETYETARRLLRHALPFWPSEAGGLAEFPALTSMLGLYPASWFIRLFGEHEASVRLPVVFFGILTVAGITRLARHPDRGPLGLSERALVRLVVAITIVVLGYHASYNPYVADLASPALHDFALIVCFLGFVNAFVVDKPWWIALWTCLCFLSWPSASVLIAFWLIGTVSLCRPPQWRPVTVAAGALSCCLVASAVLPSLLRAAGLPVPGGANSFSGLWQRMSPLSDMLSLKYFTDWTYLRRLAYLIVPSGILPAFSLVLWRRLDPVGRAMAFTVLAYFGMFYLQSGAVLHHFAPIMVLPLVVFWRADLKVRYHRRKAFLSTTAFCAFAALGLSFPHSLPVVTQVRDLGATVASGIEGYDRSTPAAFARGEILRHAIPTAWRTQRPGRRYGGMSLTWNYYAQRPKAPDPSVHYVLQFANASPPEGMQLITTESDTSLYVSSPAQLEENRALPPPPLAGSPLFRQHLDRSLGW